MFSIAVLIILVVTGIVASSIVSAGQSDNGITAAFQKQIDFVQSNNLMTDSEKVEKLCETFLFMKNQDYTLDSDLDLSGLYYNNNKFAKNQKYIKDKMKLKKEIRKKLDHKILWDNISVKINDVKIDGDTATVKAFEDYRFILDNYQDGFSSTGFNYIIGFQKYDNKWLITEVKSDDEFDIANQDSEINIDAMVKEALSSKTAKPDVSKDILDKEKKYQEELNQISVGANLTPLFTTVSYNRTGASNYAIMHSDNSGTDPNSSYCLYFPYYITDTESDCQNFGSQCVWYGFGGDHSYQGVADKSLPMYDNGKAGARSWYQGSTKYDCSGQVSPPAPYTWTSVIAFADYINNGGVSVRGPYGWINTGDISFAEVGDIIQIRNTNWYHTYVVNAVTGTYGSRTKENIWVCAHTGTRNNNRLDTAYGGSISNMRTVRIASCTNP